ncbi:MAG TPA: carbonic anhydrase [Candidatus Omnitrophota bacterium]|nr:carbonic anhydrase [Candidatus Omnitrophota bacterium]
MKYELLPVEKKNDVPAEYQDTPIGLLLEYHNLGRKFDAHSRARLLIGMCMDNRKHLKIPDNFAYIIRSGGANLRYSEFKVSYAIAVGGVRHIVLIAHDHCGMVNLVSKKDKFIMGLVNGAGWKKQDAEDHFMNLVLLHEIGNEMDFVMCETARLRRRYPKVEVAPMFYRLGSGKLYCLR